MKKGLLTLLCCITISAIQAQTVFGKWENRDDETGAVDSVVKVYEKDGKAYAKIIEIKDASQRDAKCTACKGKNKDQSILGMEILSGLVKGESQWAGGKILDPKNGKEYKCFIKLIAKNKLKIRGYIGFSVFGRTKYWYRVAE